MFAWNFVTNTSPAKKVFLSERLEVLLIEGSSPYLLITFNEAGEPANGRTVWGDRMVRSADIATLGFMARSANWFPEIDMRQAVEALAPLLVRFPERVLFGHSMGGYAAVKFSRLLGATVALSFCPQYSINPADVGNFDDRYIASFHAGLHDQMRISREDVASNVYLFYDPNFDVDRKNVDLICAAAPSIRLISMTSTGHGTITAFRGTALATHLFTLVRTADMAAIRQFAASRRRLHPERASLTLRETLKRHLAWSTSIWRNIALTMRPEVATWYASQIAMLARGRGNMAVFRRIIQYGLEILPHDPRLLDSFAHMLGQAGDFVAAAAMVRRLTEIQPDKISARLQLAHMLIRSGDDTAARVEAVTALQLDPTNEHVLLMLADIDRRSNNLPGAIEWLQRLADAHPEKAEPRIRIAGMLLRLKRFKEARAEADKAFSIAPDEVAVRKIIAEVAYHQGDLAGAIETLRMAVLLAPQDVHLHSWFAHLLLLSGQLAEARTNANIVLEIDCSHLSALCTQVEIAHRLNQSDQVVRWAHAVARAAPNDISKLEWVVAMLLRAGDLAGGQQVALSILGADPIRIGALKSLIEVSERTGNLEHAVVWAKRAVDADPGLAERHATLASLLLRQGNLTAAKHAAELAIALDPKHSSAQRCLSEVTERLGQELSAVTSV
jgi:Flp pilus assembly protein TadD